MTTKKQLIKLINRQASNRNLNPTQVAKRAGVAPSSWWQITHGDNAKWATLIKVAKSVDIKVTITAEVIPIRL